MTDLSYAPYGSDDAQTMDYIFRQAFGFSASSTEHYRQLIGGASTIRVLRRAEQVVATAILLPVDQFFGGLPVSGAAVIGVAVDPAERGRGIGTTMMREILTEARRWGMAVSILYPATMPLYRRVGYERAGDRITYKLPLSALPRRPGRSRVRRLDPIDRHLLDRIIEIAPSRGHGGLRRPPYLWDIKFHPTTKAHDVHVIDGDDGAVGYLITAPQDKHLEIVDCCLIGRDAIDECLGFLQGYAPRFETVSWVGGPEDPIVRGLPEVGVGIDHWKTWMLRVVDVTAALEARGYPLGVEAELFLEVEDPIIPENAGRYRLRVAEGRGQVDRSSGGGGPALRLDIRTLAPLFTGYLAPMALVDAGILDGPDDQLAMAGLVFGGLRPWLADDF